MDLLLARNPEPDSSLPLLLRVPLGEGLVFRTEGTWPRTSALYSDRGRLRPDVLEAWREAHPPS